MSEKAQYAALPKLKSASFNTANTNRDGTGTIAHLLSATYTKGSGTRIDRIELQGLGTTTAGMLRLFISEGQPGESVASATFVGTTATITTTTPHGRTTGQRVTTQGFFPDDYNVVDAVITVTSSTTYTYSMASTPTVVAQTIGGYSYTPATIVSRLWREIPVSAIIPSASVAAFAASLSSTSAFDVGYMPLFLPAGSSLRVATHNAESFAAHAVGGDTA